MFDVVVFILGFIFFYNMFFWLDKRKQKYREEELNSIRKIHFEPRKIETKLPAHIEPADSLTSTFKYMGEFDPKIVYEDGNVVRKGVDYYVSVKGKLELL